jgi:hypothetical protein
MGFFDFLKKTNENIAPADEITAVQPDSEAYPPGKDEMETVSKALADLNETLAGMKAGNEPEEREFLTLSINLCLFNSPIQGVNNLMPDQEEVKNKIIQSLRVYLDNKDVRIHQEEDDLRIDCGDISIIVSRKPDAPDFRSACDVKIESKARILGITQKKMIANLIPKLKNDLGFEVADLKIIESMATNDPELRKILETESEKIKLPRIDPENFSTADARKIISTYMVYVENQNRFLRNLNVVKKKTESTLEKAKEFGQAAALEGQLMQISLLISATEADIVKVEKDMGVIVEIVNIQSLLNDSIARRRIVMQFLGLNK